MWNIFVAKDSVYTWYVGSMYASLLDYMLYHDVLLRALYLKIYNIGTKYCVEYIISTTFS